MSAVLYVFTGIAVTDYHRAVAWYEAVFGRPPDVIVRDEIESMWNLAQGAWVYIVLDDLRAGKSLVTILVDDLEDQLNELSRRGIVDYELESVPGLYRKATLTDPDGNTVAFGQNLSEA
jgi:predicted enzyme related to lactoylglutathione lyase